jgi:hypothetical protein
MLDSELIGKLLGHSFGLIPQHPNVLLDASYFQHSKELGTIRDTGYACLR